MQIHVLAESAAEAPSKEVEFRATPIDKKTASHVSVNVKAVFQFVDSPAIRHAIKDTWAALREEYKSEDGSTPQIPEASRIDEYVYQTLFRALRDPDDPKQGIARTVLELRNSIMPLVAARLMTAYDEWVQSEFPDTITVAALAEMEAEAAKK